MLLVGLAVAWVLGCTAFAWRYPRSIETLRVTRWSADLAAALEQARSDAERVATANEALAEAEHALRWREGTPAAAAWLVLAGSALVAIGAALLQPAVELLGIVAAAAAGAGGCLLAARVGRRRAQRRRDLLDAAARERAGDLYDSEVELPRRKTMRWRRRRG